MINIELNYSFIFTGEELFMEKNDKIYFMIVSKIGTTQGHWDLGRIFLYKYQFVMDNDNNLIGLYKDSGVEEEKKQESTKKNSVSIIIILIIVLGLIFIAIGIILALIKKNICKNRKKRLSELDDDFMYLTKDKE